MKEENNMINAGHLFWIVPMAAAFGMLVLAVFRGGK